MQKNEAVSSICSGEKDDLKILQSDWLRIFWTYTRFFFKKKNAFYSTSVAYLFHEFSFRCCLGLAYCT